VLVELLVAAGVVLFPLPVLAMGARGLLRRPGYRADEPGDRLSYALVLTARSLALLLLFTLSALVLVSTMGAAIKDVELHGLVYIFFVLDLLLAAVVLLSFGRRDRRPARRRVSPAAR
jgi:hypothetical protein